MVESLPTWSGDGVQNGTH